MAGELVQAYIRLIPTVQGIQGATAKALAPAVGEGDKAGKAAGAAFGGAFSGIASKAAALGLGSFVALGVKAGIQTAAGLEQANVAFETMLGSATKARDLMGQIKDFAKSTPFELPEVVSGAKQLLAFGFAQDEVIDSLRRLGDVASGVGVPVGQLVNVYGQVRTSGRLMGQDLLQFTSAGVPIIKALAETMKQPQKAIKDLVSEGKVGFPEVERAIQHLTDKGGQFGGLMEKQSHTLVGVWANFTDSLNLALADAFKPLEPAVKGAITKATEAITGARGPIGSAVAAIKSELGGIDLKNLDNFDGKAFGQKLGTALTTGIGNAISGLGSMGSKIGSAIGKMLGSVDWVGLGLKAGPAAIGLAVGLVAGIINGITDPGLWSSIVDHLPEILLAVLAVALAPTKLLGPVARILGKIPFVGRFLESGLTALNGAGGKLKTAVGGFFKDLGRSFTQGFGKINIPGAGLVTKVIGSLRSLPGRIGSFIGTVGTTVGVRGLEIAEKLGSGLRRGLSKIPGLMKNGLNAIVKGVTSLPGRIAVLAGSFAAVGQRLMQSFLDGLSRAGGFVKDFASGVWQALKQLINAGITRINSALQFSIPLPGGLGSIAVNPPDIPLLAAGGILTRPTLMVGGEDGPEAIVPLSGANGRRAAEAGWGRGGGGIPRADLEWLANRIAALMGLATEGAINDQVAFAGTTGRMYR